MISCQDTLLVNKEADLITVSYTYQFPCGDSPGLVRLNSIDITGPQLLPIVPDIGLSLFSLDLLDKIVNLGLTYFHHTNKSI